MRAVLLSLLACALPPLAAGCSLPCPCSAAPAVGWRFEIGRPSTISTHAPVVLAQGSGAVSLQTLGALSGLANAPVVAERGGSVVPQPAAVTYPSMPKVMQPAGPDCTQQELCDMLRELLKRIPAGKE